MLSFPKPCSDHNTQDPATLSRGSYVRYPELKDRLLLVEAAFGATSGGFAVFDLDLRCILVNTAFAALYGKLPEAFAARSIAEVLPFQGARLALQLARSLDAKAAIACEISLPHPVSGESRIHLRTCEPLRGASGEILGIAATLLDVTERRHAEAALHESHQHARHLIELNPCMQMTCDGAGENIEISDRREILSGLPAGKISGAAWLQSIHPEDGPHFEELWRYSVQTGSPFDAEYRMSIAGKGWRWVRGRALCRRDEQGRIVQWYGMLEDIDDRKQIEEDLREKTRRLEAATRQLALLVREDHLTGLANRRHFDTTLAREVRLARRSGHPLALLMLDVDQFKHYNDSYGHVAGDLCLRRIGEALQRITRSPEDLVARYGGEEFAIVLPNTTESQAMEVAVRAIDEVRAMALEHRGRPGGRVSLSAGAAMLSSQGEDRPTGEAVSDLICNADLALYAAKRGGRDRAAAARRLVAETASS